MALAHHQLEASLAPLRICGVDEVGRGPLAGPVVAAAIIYHQGLPAGIADSKALNAAKREALARDIMAHSAYAIGMASAEEIDQINILQATMLAMKRAVEALPEAPEIALIDGNRAPNLGTIQTRTIVKGDQSSVAIAAASIIAKVTRDALMQDMAATYPHYGFERHAGYGTKAHMEALATHGACPEHRRSFAPVRKVVAA